jgi:hypothetical protein
MFDLADNPVRIARFPLPRWLGRAKRRIERLARGWSYATGRISAADAQQIMLDCGYSAGWHPLLVLTVEDTLAQARETFAEHLPWLVAEGASMSNANGNRTTTLFVKPGPGRSNSHSATPLTTASFSIDWTAIEVCHERIRRQDRLLASRL